MPRKITHGTGVNVEAQYASAIESISDITLDEYSAARMIASEHSRGSTAEQACIVDAEVNRASRHRKTLTDHLTGRIGTYGPQGRSRPASTRFNPTSKNVDVARRVLSGDLRGISRGAERFFDPRAQDSLHRKYKLGKSGKRVHSCAALGTLKAWTFDLSSCAESGYRCCSDGMPDGAARRGSHPESWVGEIEGVDAYRLMLFKASAYGLAHSKMYSEARMIITARSGVMRVAENPVVQSLVIIAISAGLLHL